MKSFFITLSCLLAPSAAANDARVMSRFLVASRMQDSGSAEIQRRELRDETPAQLAVDAAESTAIAAVELSTGEDCSADHGGQEARNKLCQSELCGPEDTCIDKKKAEDSVPVEQEKGYVETLSGVFFQIKWVTIVTAVITTLLTMLMKVMVGRAIFGENQQNFNWSVII